MRRLRTFTIQSVLIALGTFGLVVAAGLAGFGIYATSLQLEAHQRVVVADAAVLTHHNADALFDDARADVQRALLSGAGLSAATTTDIANDADHHLTTLHDLIEANANAPTTSSLRRRYLSIGDRFDAFREAAGRAISLAPSDPAAAGRAFDEFQRNFADLDQLMDSVGDEVAAFSVDVRARAARVLGRVRLLILGSLALGAIILLITTAAAVRIGRFILLELASSRADAERLALHDALTGLPNRSYFGNRLQEAIASSLRNDSKLAVLCLDLDRFKQVNDTLGHPAGDQLLRDVAERLSSCLRKSDVVARHGGDEFAIIQSPIARAEEAGDLAKRVTDLLALPFDLFGHQVVIGVSVGVAMAPADSVDPLELMKMADMALYRAKADGRGMFRTFEPEMDARLQARRMLELHLRRALAENEFEVHYQPLLNVASNRIDCVEALVRWRHPERGLVAPGEFIPLAEEIGLIERLGAWVLHQACNDAAQWPGEIRVAVNVAAVQFRGDGLVAAVAKALADSGLPPERLELEITESALLADTDATLAILRDLRSRGVRIAMDDFGTGYSSLGYLRSFPFDKLKIDRCFVKDLERDPESRAIVRCIAALGKNLGIATTAEGVETRQQLAQLVDEGCEQIQGYYVSKPVPQASLAAFLRVEPSADGDAMERTSASAA